MEKLCLFCQKVINEKNYRCVFGDNVVHYHSQIHDILSLPVDKQIRARKGLSVYICMLCFTKLNRLCRIEVDLTTKLQRVREEKDALIKILDSSFKGPSGLEHARQPTDKCVTPFKSGTGVVCICVCEPDSQEVKPRPRVGRCEKTCSVYNDYHQKPHVHGVC